MKKSNKKIRSEITIFVVRSVIQVLCFGMIRQNPKKNSKTPKNKSFELRGKYFADCFFPPQATYLTLAENYTAKAKQNPSRTFSFLHRDYSHKIKPKNFMVNFTFFLLLFPEYLEVEILFNFFFCVLLLLDYETMPLSYNFLLLPRTNPKVFLYIVVLQKLCSLCLKPIYIIIILIVVFVF